MKREILKLKDVSILFIVTIALCLGCESEKKIAYESKYLLVKGSKIHFMDLGQGEPIVFIGGGGFMDTRQWQYQIDYFVKSYRVIVIDPRGVGKSDFSKSPYADVDDVKLVLDHLSIDQAILVGLSYSGGLILDFGISYPEKVRGIVSSGPLLMGWQISESMMKKQMRFMEMSELGADSLIQLAFHEDAYFMPSNRYPENKKLAKSIIKDEFEKSGEFDPTLVKENIPDTYGSVHKISAPLLLIVGEQDHDDIHARVDYIKGQVANSSKHVISQGGHLVHLEQPDLFSKAIEKFITSAID